MPASPAPDTADEPYRLPYTVAPHAYRLVLEPDLDQATFVGHVTIDLTVHEAVTEVVANAADLVITDATLEGTGGTQHATIAYDEAEERVTFSVPEPLATGPATLRCRFSGTLNDKLRGFYRSTFTDADGATRTIATTQMESTDARRAFPCWDEPDRKATFEVTLVVAPELAAFSNSEVLAETTEDDGRRRVHFAPTMVMSTYLVAFIVGPLEATDPVDVRGVPVRVLHVPGKAHLAPYALEVAAHALGFFSDYFGIDYPADKLDLAAIPDFAFGAMENLGLVTFRETALLIDPATAARVELERVADVVCHEIAHMWFGDLVTMRWWNGIWLNEAFATFMEVLACDAFRPEWQRWVSFCAEREMAMGVDGLHSTRPIEYPVGRPEEADGMFDVLTYEKGGGVLRMLEQYLGAEVFRDGVRAYLRDHSYANTETADLWDALEAASGEPVRAMMNTWILQGGFPLVALAGDRLGQAPFALGPPDPATPSAIGSDWQIPVLVRQLDGTGPDDRLLLGAEPLTLADGGPTTVLNAGGWGFYRVAYPSDHLASLAEGLTELTTLERSNLLSDTWALVLSGEVALADLFNLAAHLGDEGDPSVWSPVLAALDLCDRVIADDDRPQLAAACRALLGPRFARLGFDPRPDDGERTPGLRAALLRALGTTGEDESVRAEAVRRFDAALAGGPAVDADIEPAVLDVVAAQLRDGDFERILERSEHPATPQEEIRYQRALASFPDVALSERAFDLALNQLRTQDAPYLVMMLLANRVAGPAVFDRLTAEWDRALERFPVNSHSRMLGGIRVLCGDEATAARVTGFLAEHPLRSGQRSVTQAVERLAANVAFGRRERGQLATTLSQVADDATS